MANAVSELPLHEQERVYRDLEDVVYGLPTLMDYARERGLRHLILGVSREDVVPAHLQPLWNWLTASGYAPVYLEERPRSVWGHIGAFFWGPVFILRISVPPAE